MRFAHISMKHCCPQTQLSQNFAQATGKPSYLVHLTDIWSISAPISLFIFCSMWVEKTFRYHWDSRSPQLDHSPPAGVVKCHDLIICADLILSSCKQWNPLQRNPARWNYLQILCHCSSFPSTDQTTLKHNITVWNNALKPTERKWERNETIKKP